MEIREMEALVALCDTGSLRDGAKALGVSPSALSRTIDKLSRECGHPLFTRSRHLILTPAGKICLDYARQIVEARNQTYRILHAMTGVQHRFSIGMSPHLDAQIFVSIFEQFQQMYPTARIDVTETYSRDAIDLLLQNRLDIVVGVRSDEIIHRSGLIFLPVQEIEYVIYISSTNVLASGGAISGEDGEKMPQRELSLFRDVPYIDSDPRALYHNSIQALFHNAGFEPIRVNRSGSIPIAPVMLKNYNAYSIAPLDVAKPVSGLRYFRLAPPHLQTKGFYLRHGYKLDRCVRDFLMLFADHLQHGYQYSAKLHPVRFHIPVDLFDSLPTND